MTRPRSRFRLTDTAQQVVGGFLLAGPFVVTEEVWVLATQMRPFQAVTAALIVVLTGYGALYKADDDRDPDRETEVGGVPVRFLSLMLVSFGSVLLLALVFDAPRTFFTGLEIPRRQWPFATAKAVSIGAIFSVVGAATADSVF